MTKYRNNHIVPEMLLRRFRGAQGLWHFDRRKVGYTVRIRKPKKIFTLRDATTIAEADGTLNTGVEQYLGRFESDLSIVLDALADPLENSKRPDFPKEIRELLILMILYQERRGRLERALESGPPDLTEAVEAGIASFEAKKGMKFPEDAAKAYRTPLGQQSIWKRHILTEAVELGDDVERTIEDSGLAYVKPKGEQRFTISTNCVFVNNEFDGGTATLRMMPITSRVALLVGPRDLDGRGYLIPDPTVTIINKFNWNNSYEIAGESEELIQSVIRAEG